jgi:NADH dehydrogenase
VGEIIGKKRPVVSVPPSLGFAVGWIIGKMVGDVMITREEIAGLMQNLHYVDSSPAGKTRLTDWARERRTFLGMHYTSELARRMNRRGENKSN